MSIAHVTEQPPYWHHRFSIESRVKERRHHQKTKHHPWPSESRSCLSRKICVDVDVKIFCCAGAPNGPLAVLLKYNVLAITIGLLSAMTTKLCPQTCPQPNSHTVNARAWAVQCQWHPHWQFREHKLQYSISASAHPLSFLSKIENLKPWRLSGSGVATSEMMSTHCVEPFPSTIRTTEPRQIMPLPTTSLTT